MTQAVALADISDALTHAYAHPKVTSVPSGPQYQMTSGFRLEMHDAAEIDRQRRLDDRRWFVGEYRADEQELRKWLGIIDVPIIGTAPKYAFERLCNEVGLLHLAPDKQGNILLDIAKLRDELRKAAWTAPWLTLSAIVVASVGFAGWKLFSDAWHYDWAEILLASLMIGVSLFLGCLAAAAAASGFVNLTSARIARRVDSWSNARRSEWLRSAMKKRQINEYEPIDRDNPGGPWHWAKKDVRESVQIRLPDPPRDVAETIRRLAASPLALRIAVVPEAVTFARPLSETLIESKRQHDAAMRELRLAFDPIIYIERGAAVALVAQYGEFPIEREVVERVANSVMLV